MSSSRLLALLGLAAASGLLIFLADFPVHAWPVQLVALVPLLVGLHLVRPSRKVALLAGIVLGLCHTVPIAIALEFPVPMAAALAGYITAVWVLFALGARWALGWRAPYGALAVGCVAVVVEWVAYSIFPAFGTAQCSARVLSAGPWLVQLVVGPAHRRHPHGADGRPPPRPGVVAERQPHHHRQCDRRRPP